MTKMTENSSAGLIRHPLQSDKKYLGISKSRDSLFSAP